MIETASPAEQGARQEKSLPLKALEKVTENVANCIKEKPGFSARMAAEVATIATLSFIGEKDPTLLIGFGMSVGAVAESLVFLTKASNDEKLQKEQVAKIKEFFGVLSGARQSSETGKVLGEGFLWLGKQIGYRLITSAAIVEVGPNKAEGLKSLFDMVLSNIDLSQLGEVKMPHLEMPHIQMPDFQFGAESAQAVTEVANSVATATPDIATATPEVVQTAVEVAKSTTHWDQIAGVLKEAFWPTAAIFAGVYAGGKIGVGVGRAAYSFLRGSYNALKKIPEASANLKNKAAQKSREQILKVLKSLEDMVGSLEVDAQPLEVDPNPDSNVEPN